MNQNSNSIKIGPTFYQKGNKRMMLMTPPIVAFKFGIEGILKNIESNLIDNLHSPEFKNLFNSTLNGLIADVLLYIQNRINLTSGKKLSITSIPESKSALLKHCNIEIKTIIGDKGYQELKKLDETRGDSQHQNDRYIGELKVFKTKINSKEDLVDYSKKIINIIYELDQKLEKIYPLYDTDTYSNENQITITTKTINHSFDINNMNINKK